MPSKAEVPGWFQALEQTSKTQGAGPINFQRDFGDTATLLLTVASPKADAREIDLRALAIRETLTAANGPNASNRVSLILCLPVIGGGAPRFWYSLAPESRHANYAQVVLDLSDEHDTEALLPELQRRLSNEITGARIDVRQLETGSAVGLPIQIRVSGENIDALRGAADQVKKHSQQHPASRESKGRLG